MWRDAAKGVGIGALLTVLIAGIAGGLRARRPAGPSSPPPGPPPTAQPVPPPQSTAPWVMVGDTLGFSLPLRDWEEPSPCTEPSAAPRMEWKPSGYDDDYRSDGEMRRALRPAAAKVRRCFLRAVRRSPGLCGTIVLAALVDEKTGETEDVEDSHPDDGLIEAGVAECAMRALARTRFRKPHVPEDSIDELHVAFKFFAPTAE